MCGRDARAPVLPMRIDFARSTFDNLEELAARDTPIHRLDPRAKVLTTFAFIVTVVSFHKYDVIRLLPLALYPVVLVSVGNLPLGPILKRLLWAAPFVLFVGVFNPLLDRHALVRIGSVQVSGGWVSFASILLRFALTVGAALILVATSGFYAVCAALEKLLVPKALVTQLLFLYRYAFVLMDEAGRVTRAHSLRAGSGRAVRIRVFGSMAGRLLLRALDRAQRIHRAMLCRGFTGEVRLARPLFFGVGGAAYLLGWTGFFVLTRWVDLPRMIGEAALSVFA